MIFSKLLVRVALFAIAIFGTGAFCVEAIADPAPADRKAVHFRLSAPIEAVQPGQTFEIPINVAAAKTTLASYALRLKYSSEAFRIVEIRGGATDGFSERPVTDPSTFSSGLTNFTAVNTEFARTPASFVVARILFEVIGEAGQNGTISILRSPNGGTVDGKSFRLLPTLLGHSVELTIGAVLADRRR